MSDTPAIEALKRRRAAVQRDRQANVSYLSSHENSVHYYKTKVSEADAEIADIDKAIEALSYPGEDQ